MSLRLTSKPFATLALVLLLGVAVSAHALTISPARIELVGDPGATISGEFVVTNEEAGGRTFYTSAQNFEARGESGTPNFVDSDTGLSSWVSLAPEVSIAEGEKRTVPFTVTIPSDADAGGHFAAIFLSTAPPGDAQVSIGAKIGVLVLLRVAGDVTEAGGVSDFGPLDGRVFTSLPVSFTYRFANSGGDRVNPRGDVIIRNLIGLKKAVIPANPGEGNVLPGSTRRFETPWGAIATEKPAGFFANVGYQWENFAVGPYRAKLALAYGISGETVETAWVFLFPWQLLSVILLFLLVLVPVFLAIVRRYNRWVVEKARSA
jgi:hypothetical protein